ncbi:MAG TPA: MFS transporter, partial [Vicinamibacteria bacterium]
LSLVPGLLAMIVLCVAVQEPGRGRPGEGDKAAREPAPPKTDAAAPRVSPTLRRFLAVLALFALGNSSDAFLLLRAHPLGVAVAFLPLLWTFHHLVKAAFSTRGGAFSDRAGRRRAIVWGWGVYALVYLGFAHASGPVAVVFLFALYGLFHALTEGPEKAFVADLAGASAHGRAFGAYHAVTGALVLPGNLLTGWLWERFGAAMALGTGAALAGLASALLLTWVGEPERTAFDRGEPGV